MITFIRIAMLLFLGVALLFGGMQERRENAAFADHGLTARLLPIQDYDTYLLYKQKSLFDEKKYVGVTYRADLTYRTQAGELVTVPSRSLPDGLLEASQRGQIITIRYLPESPTTIRLQERRDITQEGMLLGAVLLFAGLYYLRKATRKGRPVGSGNIGTTRMGRYR
jgi:hypothetical protein